MGDEAFSLSFSDEDVVLDVRAAGAGGAPPPRAGNSSTESRATGGLDGGEATFLGRCVDGLSDAVVLPPLAPPLPLEEPRPPMERNEP